MIDRICISINNRCNLACRYCHFHEKEKIVTGDMDIRKILKNVREYVAHPFKIGFVGNGESFLDFPKLKSYIEFMADLDDVRVYTITNGTIDLSEEDICFLEDHKVNVGFSVDGYKELHNLYRCNSFDKAMSNAERYKEVTGHYPTFNATVGKETIRNSQQVLGFFQQFGTRVTFSRMIGRYGITLDEYKMFMETAESQLPVRRGALDCTMYGGQCGAGANNYFFANGKVYYCGNCIDLAPVGSSDMSFYELEKLSLQFDRTRCYKENLQ